MAHPCWKFAQLQLSYFYQKIMRTPSDNLNPRDYHIVWWSTIRIFGPIVNDHPFIINVYHRRYI